MDYHINGKKSDLSKDGIKNNLKFPVQYIPAMHREIKDSVSFSGKADKISGAEKKVHEYTEEEREKICEERQLSEEITERLSCVEDSEFELALSLFDKGYFLSGNERIGNSLLKFIRQDEQTVQKALVLLDKYKEKGVDLTLYPEINTARTVNLGGKEYNRAIKLINLITPDTNPEIFKNSSIYFENIASGYKSDEQFENAYKIIETCIKTNSQVPYERVLNEASKPDSSTHTKFNLFFEECMKNKSNMYTGRDCLNRIINLDDISFNQAVKMLKRVKDENDMDKLLLIAQMEENEFKQAEILLDNSDEETDIYDIYELAHTDDKTFSKILTLTKREDMSPSDVICLAQLDESQLMRIDNLIAAGIKTDYLTGLTGLEDEKYNRIFERNMPEKYYQGAIAGLVELDDDVFSEMENKGLLDKYKIDKKEHVTNHSLTFTKYDGFKTQLVGRFAMDIKSLSEKNQVSELSEAERKQLLDYFIEQNTNIFSQINLIKTLIGDTKLIPSGKEEYCSLLKQLSGSLGVKYKPIDEQTKKDFYYVLDSMDNPDGDFINFDFTKENLKIDLEYPRREFISDIEKSLEGLSEKDKISVCNHFGFELKHNEGGLTVISGYPYNDEKNIPEDETIKQKAEEIRPFVKKFSENNVVKFNESDEITKQLNAITKAFPEFLTEIGKVQHGTHEYTLDIHSINVLQKVISHPKYKELSADDKRILKIAALFHDLTKREGLVDATHPIESAFDVYHILNKLDMSEEEKYKIYYIIKNHDWLEKYNTEENKNGILKDIAYDLRKGNSFEIESILTEADLKSVSRNNTFFNEHEQTFYDGIKETGALIKDIQKNAIYLPQNKIPKADEILIDNVNTKKKTVTLKNGREVENTYVYLKKAWIYPHTVLKTD